MTLQGRSETDPAVVDLLVQHSEMLARIQERLDESSTSYEQALAAAEGMWRSRVEALERQVLDVESVASARLEVIQQQQRTLEQYRFWWWGERLRRSWSPKLGVLYQYPSRRLEIPPRYLRLPKLTGPAPTVSI